MKTILLALLCASAWAANTGYSPTYTGTGSGCVAGGTCYYIDFVGGSDSNNGLSTGAAWKHVPGMTGASGNAASHSNAQTDEFILKGGVTWTNAAMPWVMTTGGASTPNGYAYPGMYIGYDPAWNSGTVIAVHVVDPGSCVNGTTMSVALTGGGGSGATATAQVETDQYATGDLQFVTVTGAGSGYTSNPTVAFTTTAGSCTTLPTAYSDIYSPIISGAGTVWGNSSNIAPLVQIQVDYGTIDHLDFGHMLWYAGGSYSGGSPTLLGPWGHHMETRNIFLHDFGMNGAAVAANLVGARNAAQSAGLQGASASTVTNSIFNNYESEISAGCDNGYSGHCTNNTAIYDNDTVTNCIINAWRGGLYTVDGGSTAEYIVAGNKMWAILNDPATQHPDAFYILASSVVYNNVLRDIYNGSAAFYIETGNGNSPAGKGLKQWMFNNVQFGIGTNGSGTSTPPIGWTSEFISGSASSMSPNPDLRAYNNTFYSNVGTTDCINAGQWFGASQTLSASFPFTLQNNFCVSTQASVHWFGANGVSTPCCGIWNTLSDPWATATKNAVDLVNVIITPTNATSQGYTAANNYAPTLVSNDSVAFASGGNSQNLTSLCSTSVNGVSLAALCFDINGVARPAVGGWNAGAYQFGGSSTLGGSITQGKSSIVGLVSAH